MKIKMGGIEIIQDEHVVRKVMVGIDQTLQEKFNKRLQNDVV